MSRFARLSLVQLFVVATLAATAAVGATVLAFLEASRREIVARSDALREDAARQVDERVTAELSVALAALEDIERAVRLGVVSADDPPAIEARLFSELVDHPSLSDITLTHADLDGFGADRAARLGPEHRWQVSVFRRSSDAQSEVLTRLVSQRPGAAAFSARLRARPPGGALLSAPLSDEGGAAPDDPTDHGTFVTTVSQPLYGKAIWSDLSWSEADLALPAERRRVVVSVQKAVVDGAGRFAGVVRAGLLASTIDALPVAARADGRVVLCDASGRLVARLDPGDRLALSGDDLRIAPAHVAPEVAAALAVAPRSGPVVAAGARYLVTFRKLATSQDWSVGVIVPEDHYTRDLRALRARFMWTLALALCVVLAAGGVVLRLLRRSLGRIVESTTRMRRFDFSPAQTDAPVREVALVAEGVEQAKTSLRALGRYAPIELVRSLYERNQEPQLGGEPTELSMLFTDIEGFTSLSERLEPDALAVALGAYLEVMSRAVQSTGGAIDKFIGDAVMAFWNAPVPHADHALRACRAVLACKEATAALFASSRWRDLPPLVTRYGLHRATVLVGHFGAPDRFNYTALGDGVNLAARLEPLCKQYGVTTLASEAIVEQAREEMEFRLVDRVAVKGKERPVRVYELLGLRGRCGEAARMARDYERALAAYFARDFERARGQLDALGDDPPSRVLARRCEALLAEPPPDGWDGVWVARSK